MLEWQYDDERPIYTQLIGHIQRALVTGEYQPGQKLPGVRELAAMAGVNPNTMQRALAELEAQSLVRSERTSGRFVTEDAGRITALRSRMASEKTVEYLQYMNALGCTQQDIEQYVRSAKEEN